ncbi:hypothetical protein PGT21_034743 [Puccinia graminis f. sp. tritici]|uniref:Secreted protein n=1 Tax=Puccinia graminis f. sp. tritici TaxID=56615 RepID=A0A5B0PMN5_PUCGR|nr:hypothetical protein PGT21_034743 [Puccinia graminis f. sp. tritici]
MLFSKSVIIVLIIACGFAAATELTNEQKTKCTFACEDTVKMPEGGCGKPIERDAQGRPTKWQLVKAHPTEKHPGYFNCLGADMAFSTCCVPNKLPKDGIQHFMSRHQSGCNGCLTCSVQASSMIDLKRTEHPPSNLSSSLFCCS